MCYYLYWRRKEMNDVIDDLTLWRGKFDISIGVEPDDTMSFTYYSHRCGCETESTHKIQVKELFEMIKHAHTLDDIRKDLLDQLKNTNETIRKQDEKIMKLEQENKKLKDALKILKNI